MLETVARLARREVRRGAHYYLDLFRSTGAAASDKSDGDKGETVADKCADLSLPGAPRDIERCV